MKKTAVVLFLLAGLALAQAQQTVPREDSLKAAFLVSLDLKQMLNTPIPTDPDVKRPVAVREGDMGGMILPESKLSREALAKAGKEVLPVGQLWLRKISVLCEGAPARPDQLQLVTVNAGEPATAALCALGARKDADGKLELLIYGKDKQPLLRVPLKEVSAAAQDSPIDMSAERQGDGALVTLKILGKYQATFTVVPQ
jgi:hypothetical protein